MPVILTTFAALKTAVDDLNAKWEEIEEWPGEEAFLDELVKRYSFNDQLVVECLKAARQYLVGLGYDEGETPSGEEFRAAALAVINQTLDEWKEAGQFDPKDPDAVVLDPHRRKRVILEACCLAHLPEFGGLRGY